MHSHQHESSPHIALRPPEKVMRLERMGASFQTRLSFMRQLLRRMARERWRLERVRFDVDDNGYGTSVYAAHGPAHTYSLVAFTRHIEPEERTDRVIAEVWDATFSLFDGLPADADIERLQENTPKQEGGRFLASELCLARANKSLRLFEHVVNALSGGHQPDISLLGQVGYLMRTTAVYGSGKFGCADRAKIAARPEMAAPFQAEMLTVYLVRWLTIDLVNYVARQRGGAKAIELDDDYARYLGIGNSTGLGMAPFVIKYPALINNWVTAKETAIARVRSLPSASAEVAADFLSLIKKASSFVAEWNVEDEQQSRRIEVLRQDLHLLVDWWSENQDQAAVWDKLVRYAEDNFSLEGQEFVVALVLEPHGDLIDDLGSTMSADTALNLRPDMTIASLRALIDEQYDWALAMDFSAPSSQQRFWYYSEDKLEPRLGDRYEEPGAELEMPLAIGRDICQLHSELAGHDADMTMAAFLLAYPHYRQIVRRIQASAQNPYGEVRDNLLEKGVRPLDILRFTLSFFGVSKFDPKSDLWTRVNMFQGAPLPSQLGQNGADDWAFPATPGGPASQAAP